MVINNKKNITFEITNNKNSMDIVREILKNNGLEETREVYSQKVKEKKTPWFNVLYQTSKKLAQEEITEENFKSSIISQLGVSQQVAENILKETKEKLLLLARILSEDELVKDEIISASSQKIKTPTIKEKKDFDIFPKTELPTSVENTAPTNIAPTPKRIKKVPTVVTETPKQSSGPDSYREPIE